MIIISKEIDHRYPTPNKLANDINLDTSLFDVDQPIGNNTDIYRITSLTNYYQEASATNQAQKVWDQSLILQQFKAGKIVRGRYGYQEVETDFLVLLGACGPTWHKEKTRKHNNHQKHLKFGFFFY